MFEGEPVHLRFGARGCRCGADVVCIEDCKIVSILGREDALFGECVVFESAVAIKVIGSDVEDDGNGWVELLGAFELEAGDFKNGPRAVGALFSKRYNGDADVAADERGKSGLLEDFAEE
jgi:hypothetical protein